MKMTRRDSLVISATVAVGAFVPNVNGGDIIQTPLPPRLPLDEFVKDQQLMDALRRGVRAMKARKPSDPLSWFYQAAIHGVPVEMIQVAAVNDPLLIGVDQKKYWNQCPHYGQGSANFLPWHRGYTYYFEKILRAHTAEPRFALPYWDYSRPENYKFPRDFGIRKLDAPLDGDDSNPLFHTDRNTYFTSWEHWSGNNLPYSQLTPEAVDWSPARDAKEFFGRTERDGLGGAVEDENPMTRGLLESFPHDPIHRLTGIIIPPQEIPDPSNPGHTIIQEGSSRGMSAPPTAGFDPIFCVHHSNIDRLWAEWSCMPDKEWGRFPPQDWFDDTPWYFFDVQMTNGVLKAVEVNRPRKDYFDYRSLGISFKSLDPAKVPLELPDPIPVPTPSPTSSPQLLARLNSPLRISGLIPERLAAPASQPLKLAFETPATTPVDRPLTQRVLMRLNGVNLGTSNSMGFDVHLAKTPKGKLKRSDASFVGSIAIFRHDGHWGTGHLQQHTTDHGHTAKSRQSSDMFDVTKAVRAAGNVDPTMLNVVIVPYSLSSTSDGKSTIIETAPMSFESVEFFTKE